MSWETVRLGDVAEIDRKGVDPRKLATDTTYVGLEHITHGGKILATSTNGEAELASTKFSFDEHHVLFGKLRPNLGKVARPNFSGICSTDILPVRPGASLNRDFLAHFLLQPEIIRYAAGQATGANLPRLSPTKLAAFKLPLPPLPEQRRIAAILDQADEIRANRRAQLAHLDELPQSLLHEMFGTLDSTISAAEAMPFMRNGVSPSTSGVHEATFLTLSAITQGKFDPSASKVATFAHEPGAEKRVSTLDFLMCRGNGNATLVGVGRAPHENRSDLVFPDTIIAGRIDPRVVDMNYLEVAWGTPAVRTQIERSARTTNGTYKVNQTSLGNVRIPAVPLPAQQEFAAKVEAIREERARVARALEADDELFSALQHRAFRGEL